MAFDGPLPTKDSGTSLKQADDTSKQSKELTKNKERAESSDKLASNRSETKPSDKSPGKSDAAAKTQDTPPPENVSLNSDRNVAKVTYPDKKERQFTWDGSAIKTMVAPNGETWQHQKDAKGSYIDSWRTANGAVWNGSIETNSKDGSVTLTEVGWPGTGTRSIIHANGDQEIISGNGAKTIKYANQETATFDKDGTMTSMLGKDGSLREFHNWQLDLKTGELQPTFIRVTTKDRFLNNWTKQGDAWLCNGAPSTSMSTARKPLTSGLMWKQE